MTAAISNEPCVTVTTWPSLTATRGQTRRVTWAELVAQLQRPAPRPADPEHPELPGWSSTSFVEGRRSLACAEVVTALVLDVDKGGIPLERLRAAFAGGATIIHSTRRSTPAVPRWRIVVRLSRDLTVAEHALVLSVVRAELATAGVTIDDNAKDASRFWFATCEPVDGPFVCEVLEGEPLNVEQLLAAARKTAPAETAPRTPLRVVTVNDVETRARLYARRIDPAVSGQGGHTKAFEAAQKIHRGFDLDEETSYRVLADEWNPTCSPPWSERDLRRKVDEAGKRGTMAWGALLQEQRRAPTGDAPKSGPAASRGHHTTEPKGDGAAPPPVDERPVITVDADLHGMVNAAERVLRTDPALYTRGGTLVHVVPREDDARAKVRREAGAPVIRPLTRPSARDALSSVAHWQKRDGRSKRPMPCSPPGEVADSLLARGHWPGLRPLAGIATAPILRPDGTVADAPGYDAATGYLLAFELGARVAERPTHAAAMASRDRILALVADFPFQAPEDRSAWLALCLTLACRAAILGPVPMWTVTANVRGSGKSKLIDVAATIATGRSAARATHPADEPEMGKVLTSIAVAADALVLLDNIDRPLGGGKLDAWLTGDRWSDRLLGTNDKIDLPIVSVLAATGNNLEPTGDTLRRVLPVRIESEHEHPESRDDFGIEGELLAHVRAHREGLARDLVTMAAGWYAAGQPKGDGVKPWGSYESWAALIPHICRWLELPDPMTTRAGLDEDDPKTRALRTLFARWMSVEALAGTHGVTVRELVERVYQDGRARAAFEDVAAALETLAPGRGREPVDPKGLGYVLRSKKRRRLDGKRLEEASQSRDGVMRWTVR